MTRRARWALAAVVALAAAVVLVGPWPTYGPGDLDADPRLREARRALEQSASSPDGSPPGPLSAGWGRRPLRLPGGVPLAGYTDRGGRRSTGSGEPLDVEALVLDDGQDAVAIATSDLLIVPPGVAQRVRARVAAQTPLRPAALLLGATHTHSGPGGFAPGWLARQFAGAYDPAVEEALVEAFAGAIGDAHAALAPARLGTATVRAGEYVRNRARPGAPVDDALRLLVVERIADGSRLVVAAYSAHAAVLPASRTEPSADYPGFLERALERTGAEAFFLAGAVGSTAPAPPAAADPLAQARALGEALAERAEAALPGAVLRERVDLESLGAAFRMPPLQARIHPRLRWSPFLVRWLGVDERAWLSAIRIGDAVLVGMPGDLSGEIAVPMERAAARRGVELWTLSFDGAYLGYLSPDRYYLTASRRGAEGYEMFRMNWCGPQQEAFLTRLVETAIDAVSSAPR